MWRITSLYVRLSVCTYTTVYIFCHTGLTTHIMLLLCWLEDKSSLNVFPGQFCFYFVLFNILLLLCLFLSYLEGVWLGRLFSRALKVE